MTWHGMCSQQQQVLGRTWASEASSYVGKGEGAQHGVKNMVQG
jgi:hypothetical protein